MLDVFDVQKYTQNAKKPNEIKKNYFFPFSILTQSRHISQPQAKKRT